MFTIAGSLAPASYTTLLLETFGEIIPFPFVADQKPPNAFVVVAFNETVPFAHAVPPFVKERVGTVLTVTTNESCAEQPLASV